MERLGARLTNNILIEFEILWKFEMLLFITYSADHNEILYTSRQWHCFHVRKVSMWLVECILNEHSKFLSNFEFDWNAVSGTGAWTKCLSLFSCDQAALQMVFSVCLSVCPSVCPSVCLSHLFSCDQAAIWLVQSVCPSVCPSVTPFSPCSHHRIIMKFSGVITNDKSDVHAKGQGQGSKVKVTEVNTQLNRFRTVTLVWIHIWWWNDAYSLMMLRRGALLFFKVIRQISRSHGSKKCRIWPRLGVSGL